MVLSIAILIFIWCHIRECFTELFFSCLPHFILIDLPMSGYNVQLDSVQLLQLRAVLLLNIIDLCYICLQLFIETSLILHYPRTYSTCWSYDLNVKTIKFRLKKEFAFSVAYIYNINLLVTLVGVDYRVRGQ